MSIRIYTPAGSKFVFKQIKFNLLHYIQHDFIPQRLALSKDQASMFERLVINQLL